MVIGAIQRIQIRIIWDLVWPDLALIRMNISPETRKSTNFFICMVGHLNSSLVPTVRHLPVFFLTLSLPKPVMKTLTLSLPESVMETFRWFWHLGLWMKSYSVTIQMKPLQQYFHMTLFIFQYFTNEIWDSSWILILGTLGSESVKVILTLECVMWPFKWLLFSSTFMWYYFISWYFTKRNLGFVLNYDFRHP